MRGPGSAEKCNESSQLLRGDASLCALPLHPEFGWGVYVVEEGGRWEGGDDVGIVDGCMGQEVRAEQATEFETAGGTAGPGQPAKPGSAATSPPRRRFRRQRHERGSLSLRAHSWRSLAVKPSARSREA